MAFEVGIPDCQNPGVDSARLSLHMLRHLVPRLVAYLDHLSSTLAIGHFRELILSPSQAGEHLVADFGLEEKG